MRKFRQATESEGTDPTSPEPSPLKGEGQADKTAHAGAFFVVNSLDIIGGIHHETDRHQWQPEEEL
jgi:hypothetical protein